MRRRAADQPNAAIPDAPSRDVHGLRFAALNVATLPSGQRHPQAGAEIARDFAAGHDRDRGIATIDQGLGMVFKSAHGQASKWWRIERRFVVEQLAAQGLLVAGEQARKKLAPLSGAQHLEIGLADLVEVAAGIAAGL
jgi:hypothetical protein